MRLRGGAIEEEGRDRAAASCVRSVKPAPGGSDANDVPLLPSKSGPVPDRLTIWPIDDGRYGLDATFHGGTGYERAQRHREQLELAHVPHRYRQEPDGAWTLRFGPLPAADVAVALGTFVY